jgi:hypothetical protein
MSDDQLIECAREARVQAQLLPQGRLRDALLERARQYEAQISMNVVFDKKLDWRPKRAP